MKYELIAEVSNKEVNFYISGGHFASCYPKEKQTSLTTNVYRKLKGQIKKFFTGNTYVKLSVQGVKLNSETFRKLEQEARDIVMAQKALQDSHSSNQ